MMLDRLPAIGVAVLAAAVAAFLHAQTPEIAGQRRSKRRGLTGYAGVIPGKTGKTIGDIAMVGGI